MIALIVAMSKNRVIGNKGSIPWHLPDDFKHFKDLTSGHTVIMGRKTFESIGRPLPDRKNIIVTSQAEYSAPGCEVATSLISAIQANPEAFIIGGESLYKESLPIADKVYLTEVETTCEGDTFFPEISDTEWKLIEEEFHANDAKHSYAFTFKTYDRRK